MHSSLPTSAFPKNFFCALCNQLSPRWQSQKDLSAGRERCLRRGAVCARRGASFQSRRPAHRPVRRLGRGASGEPFSARRRELLESLPAGQARRCEPESEDVDRGLRRLRHGRQLGALPGADAEREPDGYLYRRHAHARSQGLFRSFAHQLCDDLQHPLRHLCKLIPLPLPPRIPSTCCMLYHQLTSRTNFLTPMI